MQYAGHVVGTTIGVWLLARYGRQRWMAASAARVEPFRVTVRSTSVVVLAVLAGSAAGVLWVLVDLMGMATNVLRFSACCFLGLLVGCGVLRTPAPPPAVRPGSGGVAHDG